VREREALRRTRGGVVDWVCSQTDRHSSRIRNVESIDSRTGRVELEFLLQRKRRKGEIGGLGPTEARVAGDGDVEE
jgi:hypothetical protein